MTKTERTKIIVERVLQLDAKFGHVAPPRSIHSTSPTRMISDDPRWEARYSKRFEKDREGKEWDLFELFVYKERRLTAIVRGEEVVPRFYIPGKWEPIFLDFDPNDTVPLLPN